MRNIARIGIPDWLLNRYTIRVPATRAEMSLICAGRPFDLRRENMRLLRSRASKTNIPVAANFEGPATASYEFERTLFDWTREWMPDAAVRVEYVQGRRKAGTEAYIEIPTGYIHSLDVDNKQNDI